MPKASPIFSSFNAGEFSPLIEGRTDYAKYAKGARKMINFIPTIQGPAVRRGGTRFVAETKDSSARSWFVKFQFNVTQAYALEFGNYYVRFYTNHGQVVNADGTPYEIASPYSTADLVNADGAFGLRYAQSADVLYIMHPSHPPQKLSRSGALSWAFSTVDFLAGPFDDQNKDKTSFISISSDQAYALSTGGIFTADMVGTLLYLESIDFSIVGPWQPGKQIAAVGENPLGLLRRADQRVYQCTDDEVASGLPIWTGTVTPVHTSGIARDGDGEPIVDYASSAGVHWKFLHPGYAVFKITGFTNANRVSVTLQSEWTIPTDYITDTPTSGTWRYAFARWSSGKGWPDLVTFFRNRLVCARSADQAIDFSVSADYENFQDKDFGTVTADMAVSGTVAADQEYNALSFISSQDQLLIGGASGEFIAGEQTTNDVFGPDNFKITKQSGYGSRSLEAIAAGNALLYVQKGGRQLMEMNYNIANNSYDSDDKSVQSEHLMIGGLIQTAFQKESDSIVWAVRADGLLLSFTYQPKQDVYAWAQMPIGGTDAAVESVCVLPAPTLDRSELWLIVKRTINGVTKRYVEYMERPFRAGDVQSSAFYMDAGLTYNGVAATTISGLDHLEGQTVDVLTDGATHPTRVVTNGAITLQQAGSVVSVGLTCPCRLVTERIDAGAADGTAQGKTKRIHKLVMRFYNSLGGKYGPQDGPYDNILTRAPSDDMDAAVPLLTGDTDILDFPGDYDLDGVVDYVNDQPLPVTIVAIMPQLITQDR